MRAAESDQRVRRVTEAEQRSTNFEIQVRCGGTLDLRKPGVKDQSEDQHQEQAVAYYGQSASVFPKKPGDLCPIPQNNPQSPEKTGNTRDCTYRPFFVRGEMLRKDLILSDLQSQD